MSDMVDLDDALDHPGVPELLDRIDARLARLEATLDEYRPLLDLAQQRVNRGGVARRLFATGGNET